jgi:hypothetical protein
LLGVSADSHGKQLYTQLHRYFWAGEYLLANSAYTASETVVPAFKRSPGKQLPAEKKDFNYTLRHQRVKVENCIGMLKNQW